ncbi:MAG: hypothetical protein RLZZ480_338 [Candidatus Parcubacteria bacterium]|jgi:putative hydrolase of the HAD superfamily
MVTCIVFDIDGTLIDESESLILQTNAVAWKFGDSLEKKQRVVDAFFAANDRAVAEGGQYKNDIAQYMRWMGEALGVVVSSEEAVRLADDWREAFSGTFRAPQVFADSVLCLETLRAKGLTLIAVSGGTTEKKQSLLKEANLAEYFENVFAATDIGFQKQDVRFWQQLLKDLNISAETIMVVGNQINDDIMHPKALGMETVLINRPGLLRKDLGPKDLEADYTIENLGELTKLIE